MNTISGCLTVFEADSGNVMLSLTHWNVTDWPEDSARADGGSDTGLEHYSISI